MSGFPPQFAKPQYIPYPIQQPTQNNFTTNLIIGILILIGVVLFIPLEYYYFGKQYKSYIKNEYLAKRVFDFYNKSQVINKISTYYVKEQWSLFDFLMLSILSDKSINVTIQPISIKIGNDKFYLNKEDSLKSIDVQSSDLLYSIDFSDFIKKNQLENVDNAQVLFDNTRISN